MLKRAILSILIFILISSPLKVLAYIKPNITAQGAILIDLNSGQMLYGKNINSKFGPASTTKIMTALITLEKCKLDEKVVVGKKPPFEEGSKIYLNEGEELTVEQLLYAMMLESANDAALALAEYIGGSKEGFAKIMNDKAAELGCKNTNFVNPNGLYDDNHYTTAYDLALIAKKAMENPKFREIVATQKYQIQATNKQPETRYLHNHNKMLAYRGYKYEGCDGVKTGYTIKSKHTFVGSATRGDMRLLVVILNDEKPPYDDVKKLFDYGFNNFVSTKVLNKNDIISSIKINNGQDIIPVYPKEDYYITTPKSENIPVSKNIVLNQTFTKISKGETIGYVELSRGQDIKIQIPLISGVDYQSMMYNLKSAEDGKYKKVLVKKFIYIPLSVFLGLFLIRGFYRKYKKYR